MTSKRKYEKIKKEEQEAAQVFQDFIQTFQNPSCTPNKKFIRSSTLYSANQSNEKIGQVYNPKPVITSNQKSEVVTALECAKIFKPTTFDRSKKPEKAKSNLDELKEELKMRQAERCGKENLKDTDLGLPALSYFEGGDPNSTNLFITNLDPKITENYLMLQFGAYGPLASVKIMWPRGDDKSRNTNCGFVAYMSRKDAERALRENKYREDMKVGWGKSVEIPAHPIYVPNDLLKLFLPPPLTGLPFNAQLLYNEFKVPTDPNEFDVFLKKCQVKVTVPLNKKILALVHRTVEFVVREGPMFEAFIMNKEIRNPDFNFLFDCQSPIHVYYRWKIFSILSGDSQKHWSMKPFRMFKTGSIWFPPNAPNYVEGMPDELIKKKRTSENTLTENQLKKLISLIRNLTMARSEISNAMYFCMQHKNAISDSIDLILESLTNLETNPVKRIARLYLLSDVLTNCVLKRSKIDVENMNSKLLIVFESLQTGVNKLKTAHDKDNYNFRILKVIHHWDVCQIFYTSLIHKIEAMFQDDKKELIEDDSSSTDEPLDGVKLLQRSLGADIGPEVVTSKNYPEKVIQDTDLRKENNLSKYFIPSKWDTIDPEEVEAQAMSTEKLFIMELENKIKNDLQKRKKKRKR